VSHVPASAASSAVRVSATVAPCTRDPRTRTDLPVDPRLQSTASIHQTAIVLPTQAKPSSTVTAQPDTATQVEQTANSGTVENIFDRLLKDLNPVKSERVATSRVADSSTYTAASDELKSDVASTVAADSSASKDSHIVYQETDTIRKSASPRPAAGKPDDIYHDSKIKLEETQSDTSLLRASSRSPKPNRTETEHSDTKHSDMVCDETDRLSGPSDNNRDSDWQSRHRGGPKSSRRRSSQEREKPKGEGLWTTDVRGKEKDAGPVAKRMRREKQRDELKAVDSPESQSSDFT